MNKKTKTTIKHGRKIIAFLLLFVMLVSGSWKYCEACESLCQTMWANEIAEEIVKEYAYTHPEAVTIGRLTCGQTVPHELTNGQCDKCGHQVTFEEGLLPEEYYEECPERGTILTLNYKANRYYNKIASEDIHTAKLYLPYGYDPYDKETRYNVVIVVHGGNGDESTMMDEVHRFYGKAVSFRTIFDNMIYRKDCEPFIAVTINTDYTVTGDFDPETGERQYGSEIRNVLLPYIAKKYNTYAKDGSIAALREARQHFGMVGGSNGSLYTMEAGILTNLDIIGNFGLVSGISQHVKAVEKLNEEADEYPVYCLFGGAGTMDHMYNNTTGHFSYIEENSEAISTGKNAFYQTVKAGHDWELFTTDTYNFLLVMGQNIE